MRDDHYILFTQDLTVSSQLIPDTITSPVHPLHSLRSKTQILVHLIRCLAMKHFPWHIAAVLENGPGVPCPGYPLTLYKRYTQGALARGRYSLLQLRDLRDAVSSLQLAVEGAVMTLESAMRPYVLHTGFKSLPNEVLALIFEQVYELGKTDIDTENPRSSPNVHKTDFVDWRVPVRLSHVDHRFRSVAMKCPGLWTSISYCYRRDMVKTFLQRSGRRAGLTICFDVYYGCISAVEVRDYPGKTTTLLVIVEDR